MPIRSLLIIKNKEIEKLKNEIHLLNDKLNSIYCMNNIIGIAGQGRRELNRHNMTFESGQNSIINNLKSKNKPRVIINFSKI